MRRELATNKAELKRALDVNADNELMERERADTCNLRQLFITLDDKPQSAKQQANQQGPRAASQQGPRAASQQRPRATEAVGVERLDTEGAEVKVLADLFKALDKQPHVS